MKQSITETIEIPDGLNVTITDTKMTVKGQKSEVSRRIILPRIKIGTKGKNVEISCTKATKREKKQIYTTIAHLKNMLQGAQTPYKYTLKICSGHFPINVSVSNNQFIVKNFLGEKVPRTMPLKQGVTITISGDQIIVESPDKEMVGQTASEIELLTTISNRDPRVFQDGIYLIEKNGQPLK